MSQKGVLSVILRIAAVAFCCVVLAAPASLAQNAGGLPGFFQNLFGGFHGPRPAPAPQQLAPAPPMKEQPRKPRKRSDDFVATSTTRTSVEPKAVIAVLGDSLSLLAGQGLI